MTETAKNGRDVVQRFAATLDAFKAVASDKRTRDRKERLLHLQRWVHDVFGENSIKDVAGRCLLANVCLKEVIEISENPEEQQAVSSEVLQLFEECVYHLFFCTSGCLTTISPGNSATPISATTLLRVVKAGMNAVHIVFLSERWRELAGEESWCQIVEMYRAFVEDLVEAVTAQGPSQISDSDRIMLITCVCKKLFEIGVPLADWQKKSYAALKVTWVSVVALLNALPEQSRESVAKEIEVKRVFFTMVEKLREAVTAGRMQKDPKQIKVARFWLVLIGKLVPSYPEAFHHIWGCFLDFVAKVQIYLSHSNLQSSCPDEKKVQQEIQEVVQGKLAVISRQVLSELPKEQTMAVLEGLCKQHAHDDHPGNVGLEGQALVILLLLGESPAMPPQLRHMFVPCFKWMLKTLAVDFFHQSVSSKAMREAIFRKCFLFLLSCCKDSAQGSAGQTWKLCQRVLLELALEGHPMLSEILGAIWGAMLSKSSSRMQKMHISSLFSILSNLVVGCLVNASIDNKTRQLAFLHTRLLLNCNEEVQQRVWERVFDTESIMSLHRTAVGCVILEASHQPIPHKCQASKWARDALKTLQQIESAILETPHAANKAALEQHGHWLFRCLASLFRNSSQYGHHLDAEDSILTAACEVVQQWEKRPPSFLSPALEILASGGSDLPKFHCAQLLPVLSKIVISRQHTAEPVARLCKQTALTCPPSEDLFHALLSHPHWLVMHHAMEAVVAIARQSDHPNLLDLVPVDIRGNSDENSPFVNLLKAYLQRRHDNHPDRAATVIFKTEHELRSAGEEGGDIDGIRAGIERIKLQHAGLGSAQGGGGGGGRGGGGGTSEVLVRLEQCIEDVGRERKRLKAEALDRFNQEVERLGGMLVKSSGDGGWYENDFDLMEQ
ncbi:hypothetical protein BSKO_05219 [Bryopsis sp. KO-2023]|nr:hypothetical protein BSKO_05219 [Bryopsis sp. KO-2023]